MEDLLRILDKLLRKFSQLIIQDRSICGLISHSQLHSDSNMKIIQMISKEWVLRIVESKNREPKDSKNVKIFFIRLLTFRNCVFDENWNYYIQFPRNEFSFLISGMLQIRRQTSSCRSLHSCWRSEKQGKRSDDWSICIWMENWRCWSCCKSLNPIYSTWILI